jgi:hypothetical protein
MPKPAASAGLPKHQAAPSPEHLVYLKIVAEIEPYNNPDRVTNNEEDAVLSPNGTEARTQDMQSRQSPPTH